MKTESEILKQLECKESQFNDKDNTDNQNNILYGCIIALKWVLDKNEDIKK